MAVEPLPTSNCLRTLNNFVLRADDKLYFTISFGSIHLGTSPKSGSVGIRICRFTMLYVQLLGVSENSVRTCHRLPVLQSFDPSQYTHYGLQRPPWNLSSPGRPLISPKRLVWPSIQTCHIWYHIRQNLKATLKSLEMALKNLQKV